MDRIRRAVGQWDVQYLLSGIVEMDTGYIGSTSHNGKRSRGTDKAKIVVAVSKMGSRIPLFARMKVVKNMKGKTLQDIVNQYFEKSPKVEYDGYKSYLGLENVETMSKKYETDDLYWLHKAIGNLNAYLRRTYHGRCTKLKIYLDEYCFRFTRRMTNDQIFLRLT